MCVELVEIINSSHRERRARLLPSGVPSLTQIPSFEFINLISISSSDVRFGHATQVALEALLEGVAAVYPPTLVSHNLHYSPAADPHELRIGDKTFSASDFDEIVVVGGGKASGLMAAAVCAALGELWPVRGAVSVPHDQLALLPLQDGFLVHGKVQFAFTLHCTFLSIEGFDDGYWCW